MNKVLDLESLLARLHNSPMIVVYPVLSGANSGDIEVVSPSKIYSCEECCMNFKFQREVKQHTRTHHQANNSAFSSENQDLIQDLS